MSRQTGKVNIALFAAAVLLSLTLFTTYLTSGLYARFATSDQSSDSAKVAAFVFDVNEEKTIEATLEQIRIPGDEQTYTFTVTNKRGDIKSEVAQTYAVKITARGSLPLYFTLTENDENKYNMDADVNGNTLIDESDETFRAAVEIEKTYELKVSWPKEKNNLKYASGSGIASLCITLESEQID